MPIIDNNDSRKAVEIISYPPHAETEAAFEGLYGDTLVDLTHQDNRMAAGHGSYYKDRETDDMFTGFQDGYSLGKQAAQQHFLKMLESEEVAAAVTDGLAAEALAAAKGKQRYTEEGAFTERLSKASLSAIKAKLGAA